MVRLFYEPKIKGAFAYCPSSGGIFQLDENEYRAVLNRTGEGAKLIEEMKSYEGERYSVESFVSHLTSVGITVGRVSRPVSAELELTLNCNLRCKHCIVSAGRPAENELSTGEWIGLIEELDAVRYTLTGGEPLMHEGFAEIVRAIKDSGSYVKILTNGTLVGENLGAFEPLGKDDLVQVSLDGTEGVHDTIRGKGTYRRAVEGIKALVSAGVRVSVAMTLLPWNVDSALDLYREVSGLGIAGFSLGWGLPVGRLKKGLPYVEYLATAEKLREEAKRMGVPVSGGTLGDSLPVRPESVYTCEAGTSSLFVTSTGDVYPCLLFRWSDFLMGNVHDEGILDIWGKSGWERLKRNLSNTKCASCPLFGACRGGCPGEALLFSGTINAPAPSCRLEEREH